MHRSFVAQISRWFKHDTYLAAFCNLQLAHTAWPCMLACGAIDWGSQSCPLAVVTLLHDHPTV